MDACVTELLYLPYESLFKYNGYLGKLLDDDGCNEEDVCVFGNICNQGILSDGNELHK